jgi:hypothetical protein
MKSLYEQISERQSYLEILEDLNSSTYDELCFFVRQWRIPKELEKSILVLDHESLKKMLARLLSQTYPTD